MNFQFDSYDDLGDNSNAQDTAMDLELLMNNKVKDNASRYLGGGGGGGNLTDIRQMDNEFDDYAGGGGGASYKPQSNMFSDPDAISAATGFDMPADHHTTFNEIPTYASTAAADLDPNGGISATNTWDTYGKYDNIPQEEQQPKQKMTEGQIMREKMRMIRQMEKGETKYGYKTSKRYTMSDPYPEILAEYEVLQEEINRTIGIGTLRKAIIYSAHTVEALCNKYNPFDDVDITGYSEELSDEIDTAEYDEVLDKLHVRYKSYLEASPELQLMFMLGGGMALYSHRRVEQKKMRAGNGGRLQQNGLNQFHDANQLYEQSMMQSMINQAASAQQAGGMPSPPYVNQRAPLAQPSQVQPPFNSDRGGNNAAGQRFQFAPASQPPMANEVPSAASMRPEMAGPTNIDSLLSNLQAKKDKERRGGGGNIRTATINIPDGGSGDSGVVVSAAANEAQSRRSRRPAAAAPPKQNNPNGVIQLN